jgi:hypothetical protein
LNTAQITWGWPGRFRPASGREGTRPSLVGLVSSVVTAGYPLF